jgi:N-acetylglucosaminyl-diphospho-decaprenol L-rhamnosyltransferase
VAAVDVVIVSYNSRQALRACVEPLSADDALTIFVVDNASPDKSLEVIADLAVRPLPLARNVGFASACNRGFETGSAPFVLFLNPDATIASDAIERLAAVLAGDESIGAVAPRLLTGEGRQEHSLRRFPRLRSTYSQSLFLHRLFPYASWVDEVIREPSRYARYGPAEWVSGACVLVRRTALASIGGWDEEFFLYGEDVDLCRRLTDAGQRIVYEPAATAVHAGGGSAPRAQMLPQLVRGRIQFVKKHERPVVALLHQAGLAIGCLTHAALTTQGPSARRGYRRAFLAALRPGSAALAESRVPAPAASESQPRAAG